MFSVKDVQTKVTKALLIGIRYPAMDKSEAENLLNELHELVETLDIPVVGKNLVHLRERNSQMLLGKGKAAEIADLAKKLEADVIVFDDDLTPAQQRNWEATTKLCVIDRHEVILDIFASRAHTREAILQVGLARMEYSLPRLKRAWTHLSRQRGGGTGARGQGETQLESDRRMVNARIVQLKQKLKDVIQQRDTQRQKRLRKPVPTAAIIGYTNAGKSSLLNSLTGSGVMAEDKLFATLDPTTRQLTLPNGQILLLTDTVGFVRKLPHSLVEAFKATLEEVVVADFLVHVMDITSPDIEKHAATTLRVMRELGASEKRVITVFNKIDCSPDSDFLKSLCLTHPDAFLISAKTGKGLDQLRQQMASILDEIAHPVELLIPYDRYDIISKLHTAGGIRSEETTEQGIYIKGAFPPNLSGLIAPFLTDIDIREKASKATL